MKHPKRDLLDSLLAAAAKDRPAPLEAPLGLETRVLAQWRTTRRDSLAAFDSVPLLRAFLLGSLAVMAVVGALQFSAVSTAGRDRDVSERIADSALLTSFGR
jgi:hypothetical protein